MDVFFVNIRKYTNFYFIGTCLLTAHYFKVSLDTCSTKSPRLNDLAAYAPLSPSDLNFTVTLNLEYSFPFNIPFKYHHSSKAHIHDGIINYTVY